tara:strand:- start:124 stop:309 length:186 start_codon:yes stop_codon:yes gene_type:complete
MSIKLAKYVKSPTHNPNDENTSIALVYNDDSTWSVPLTVGNRHYDAILEWVEDSNTIEDAD